MAREVKVPDMGDFEGVEVIDVMVKAGDRVAKDDSLITLESDKAAMDVPAPFAGRVSEVKVKRGDRVSEGDVILLAEVDEGGAGEEREQAGGKGGEAGAGDRAEESERAEESGEASPAAESAVRRSPPATVMPEEVPQTAKRDAPPLASEREDTEAFEAARAKAEDSCDVLVIGAGPGGYTAAFRAADLGRDVVLVESHKRLGGVCLNVGCIPSKALLHAAEVIESAHAMSGQGLEFGGPKIQLDKLRAFAQKAVDRLTGGLSQMARQRKVRVLRGQGFFTGPHVLAVDDGTSKRTVAFRRAIIAAGSQPMRLAHQPEDERIMDSTGALKLVEIPKKLLVVGGGIIGLEMAQVYAALGAAVTVVELTDGLMPGTDRDLVRVLERHLRRSFGSIHLDTRVQELKPQKNGIRARFAGPEQEWGALFDRVLVAIGRRPNGHDVGADAAGVSVNERGFITVDGQMRTNVAHIFAIGDVVGVPLLAHKASHEGKVAAEAACGKRSHFDVRAIPSVAYTHPEVAWAGLSEIESRKQEIAVRKATFPWQANGRALTLGVDFGMTKLLFDERTGRIVGAGLVGPNAGELIAELVLAIEMGCDAEDIALSIHPHPTLSESVGMAAEVAAGTITDLYLPRRR